KLVRAAHRDEHIPLLYMEPVEPSVLGLDFMSRPLAVAPATEAWRTNSVVASERFKLVEDPPGTWSVALYAPIFEPNLPLATEAERKQALVGFGVVLFRLEHLVQTMIGEEALQGLEFVLVDETAGGQVLYESTEGASGRLDNERAWSPPIVSFGNREWRLTFVPTETSGAGLLPW